MYISFLSGSNLIVLVFNINFGRMHCFRKHALSVYKAALWKTNPQLVYIYFPLK